MFKELFKKLSKNNLNNYDASDGEKSKSPIWSEFHKENLTVSRLKETLSSIQEKISCKNDIVSMLENIDSKSDLFDACQEKDETFWENLFLILRDRGCKKIDANIKHKTLISIQCAGETRDMTFEELGSNILDDYGDTLNTQTAVPETVLFEEDKKMLMENLKREFDSKTSFKSKEETKLILSQVKQSSDAKCVKDLQSLEAEVLVQNKLIELGKEENVTMVVFRGIKTFECIGQFLTGFGLEFSKIR